MDKHNLYKNQFMLKGDLAHDGYDWWWHSFTGTNKRTGESQSFFIEYFIINPQRGRDYPIFTDIDNQIQPSYLMIKAGCWGKNAKQLHRYYGISEYDNSKSMLKITTKDSFLSENNIWGSVNVSKEDTITNPTYYPSTGKMNWSLKVNKVIPFNVGYGTSLPFRLSNAFEMYWHVEGMKTMYSGTVNLDGEEFIVSPDNCYGYADKNWGSNFTSPWIWLSSCNLTSKLSGLTLDNSAFDIGGGCPKVFGIPFSRKLLMNFTYEGEVFEFNFSKFWSGTRTKFKCYETESSVVWKIKTINFTSCMEVSVSCPKSEMLLVEYKDPNGARNHTRLWNGGTGIGHIKLYKIHNKKRVLVDDIIAKNVGCEFGEFKNTDNLE